MFSIIYNLSRHDIEQSDNHVCVKSGQHDNIEFR